MSLKIRILKRIEFQSLRRLREVKENTCHEITKEEYDKIKRFEGIYFSVEKKVAQSGPTNTELEKLSFEQLKEKAIVMGLKFDGRAKIKGLKKLIMKALGKQ